MAKISNARLFTAAWQVARNAAAKFGGKAREFFREALRMAHEAAKQANTFNTTQKAAKVEKTAAQKLNDLAGCAIHWGRETRKSFAYRFIMDNAERLVRFGDKIKLSEKQVSIINDMHAKYC